MRDFDPTASEFISSGYLRHSRPDALRPQHHLPAAIVTAMAVGAAVGAVTAAITGGNILKGALFGAIGGGISSAIAGAFGGAAGGSAGAAGGGLEGAAGGIGGGEAGAAAGITGVTEAAAAVPFESGFVGTEALSGAAGTGTAAVPATVGSGMQAAIEPSLAAGAGNAGTATTGVEAATGGNTGVSSAISNTGTVAGESSGSFLDQLLNKGKGMLNNRFVTDTAGQVLKGYAGGRQQEAVLEARRREVEDARANARFGNVGSRYGGMINTPAIYK